MAKLKAAAKVDPFDKVVQLRCIELRRMDQAYKELYDYLEGICKREVGGTLPALDGHTIYRLAEYMGVLRNQSGAVFRTLEDKLRMAEAKRLPLPPAGS